MTTPGLKTGRPGPLTDTELRASAVSVTGPVTDAELRAAPVPIALDEDTTRAANLTIEELLSLMLLELKTMNLHLQSMTDEKFLEGDII